MKFIIWYYVKWYKIARPSASSSFSHLLFLSPTSLLPSLPAAAQAEYLWFRLSDYYPTVVWEEMQSGKKTAHTHTHTQDPIVHVYAFCVFRCMGKSPHDYIAIYLFIFNIDEPLSNVLDTKSSLSAWLRENERRHKDANTYLRPWVKLSLTV